MRGKFHNESKNVTASGLGMGDGVPAAREESARLLLRCRERLLFRARRKLGLVAWSRLDPDDLLSSGLRRVDLLWVRGIFPVASEEEFWAVVMTVFFNAAIDRARLWKRLEAADCLEGVEAAVETCGSDEDAAVLVHRMVMALRGDMDREVFLMRLRGQTFAEVGRVLGCTEEAMRQRWRTIRLDLLMRFQSRKIDERSKNAALISLGDD